MEGVERGCFCLWRGVYDGGDGGDGRGDVGDRGLKEGGEVCMGGREGERVFLGDDMLCLIFYIFLFGDLCMCVCVYGWGGEGRGLIVSID